MDKNKVNAPSADTNRKYSTPRMQNVGVFSSGARGAIVKKNLK